jgi:carboxyl-terminal processing protease
MSNQKKYLPLIMGVAVAMGIFIGAKLNFADRTEKIFATNSKKDKLNRLIDYIDYEYVDQINTDSIVDVTVNSILKNLDPHSTYIPVKDYAATAEDMRGRFVGIGVSFYVYKDTVTVIATIPGGPAEKAGLKGGDRILFADDKALLGANISRDSITSALKGALNSKVKLKVLRRGKPDLLQFTLTRKEVPLVSVDAAYLLEDAIGYIKVNRFSETTYDEFKTALQKLTKQNIKTLVLDLRDNPGGYISAAERMLDELIPKGNLILITKNKRGNEERSFTKKNGLFEDGDIYVLVNENSASASEIIAGALQDNDKATILGRRTYGKGLVQREMSLGDGSAVRLTVARYYTPTGRSIQRPYENGNRSNYYNEYKDRYTNGEMLSADSISVNDSLRFVTPKGKVVYGGGGIIPDVFVSKDTSDVSETLSFVLRSGYLSYFIFEQLEENRNAYSDWTVEDFITNFETSNEMLEDFINYSRLNESNLDLAGYETLMKHYMKATLAQQLFGGEFFEQIINQNDPMLMKVLELHQEGQGFMINDL